MTIFPGLAQIRQAYNVNYNRFEDPISIEIDLLNGVFINIEYTTPGFEVCVFWLWDGLTLETAVYEDVDEMLETVSHWAYLYTREVVEQDTYESTIIMGRHRIFQCLI